MSLPLAATTSLLLIGVPTAVQAPADAFGRVATFGVYRNTSADDGATAEISALSSDGKTVIYTDSPGKRIGFVNIADSSAPAPGGVLAMPGEPTSDRPSRMTLKDWWRAPMAVSGSLTKARPVPRMCW